MKIIFILSLIVVLFVPVFSSGSSRGVLEEIMKPEDISVDPDMKYIYITENTTIFIYDLKSLKLIKKFGRSGEGPKEFKNFASTSIQKGKLIINSEGKISFFSKEGDFISEIRCPSADGNNHFYYFNNNYIGLGSRADKNGILFQTLTLFNKDLKKIKEIYNIKHFSQLRSKQKIYWPPQRLLYRTYNDIIVVAGKPGFRIDIIDKSGNIQKKIINMNYQQRAFTLKDEKENKKFLKRKYRERYNQAKKFLVFPKFFPSIRALNICKGILYVITNKQEENKIEIIKYNLQGEFLGNSMAEIKMQNPVASFPFNIWSGKMYQLVENKNEKWELNITKI